MNFLPDVMDTMTLSEKGIVIPIIRLDTGEQLVNEGVAVSITAKGPDSDAYEKARLEVQRRRIAALSANEEFDEKRALNEFLALITTAWTGMLNSEGKEAACNPENAGKLYSMFPLVRDQVDVKTSNRRNFILGSPQS